MLDFCDVLMLHIPQIRLWLWSCCHTQALCAAYFANSYTYLQAA